MNFANTIFDRILILRGPTLKIAFICFLDAREQELSAGFYYA